MKRWRLLYWVGYPFVLFATLFIVARSDPFAIFDETYLLATSVALPAAVMTAAVIDYRRGGGPAVLPIFFLALWVGALTLAHFWLVMEFAKGV